MMHANCVHNSWDVLYCPLVMHVNCVHNSWDVLYCPLVIHENCVHNSWDVLYCPLVMKQCGNCHWQHCLDNDPSYVQCQIISWDSVEFVWNAWHSLFKPQSVILQWLPKITITNSPTEWAFYNLPLIYLWQSLGWGLLKLHSLISP